MPQTQSNTKDLSLCFLENYVLICHLLADRMETDCVGNTCQSIGQYSGHAFHNQTLMSHC